MIIRITFFVLLFSSTVYSETINLLFDKPIVVSVTSAKQKNGSRYVYKYNALASDVETNSGKFRIVLIDFNKNNIFNDSSNSASSKERLDLVHFVRFKESDVKFPFWQRQNLKNNYPLVINGITYRLQKIKRVTNKKYSAILVKQKVALHEIIKNKNGVLINVLPELLLANNKKSIQLKKNMKIDKYLYVSFYDGDVGYLNFPVNYQKLKKLRKYHLKSVCVGIIKSKTKKIWDTGERYNKNDLFFVDVTDLKKLIKLGFNDVYPSGILFDTTGKVIKQYINIEDLELFLREKID